MRHGRKKHRALGRRHTVTAEPLAHIFSFGTRRRTAIFAALAALLFHGTATAKAVSTTLDMFRWADALRGTIAEALDQEYAIEQEKVEPPPVEEKPEPQKAEPQDTRKKEDTPPPPPAAAEAAKVLTQEPNPDEPVDLTNAMVTGTGTDYAGGETRATGTSKEAVRNVATALTGTPGGTGPVAPPTTVDLSRPPQLAGSSDWKCPWPQEADNEQIDEAFVTIQVTVEADGKASKVAILSGGDHGFGREARGCALRETYKAGLDRAGKPVSATKSFRIHFER